MRYYDTFSIPDRPPSSSTIMTTVMRVPRRRKIGYPDSDGKPMSDHDLQYKRIVVIKEELVVQFRGDPDV
jgi:hypothetical protein